MFCEIHDRCEWDVLCVAALRDFCRDCELKMVC
jgi:hypothetical protein